MEQTVTPLEMCSSKNIWKFVAVLIQKLNPDECGYTFGLSMFVNYKLAENGKYKFIKLTQYSVIS